MRKIIYFSLMFLSLFFTQFLTSYNVSVRADANVIHVPGDFSTIQEAINNANEGDTIFVYSGQYSENIVIDKSLSLIGENAESTIIEGNGTGNVIEITADNVLIKGFTIKKSGENYFGICIINSRYNVISHNIIVENSYGIGLYLSSNNIIENNVVSNNTKNGVYVVLSSINNVITANTISLNGVGGMYFDSNSFSNLIFHNNFIDNYSYHARSEAINAWDYMGEGNYWSSYKGEDVDDDGIGEEPFIIDLNNKDNYPLKGMFFGLDINFEGEAYYITIICNLTVSKFKFKLGTETGNRILSFSVSGEKDMIGFCRITVPIRLMDYPYIILVDGEERYATLLDVSNETHVSLYFTYSLYSNNLTINIISSRVWRAYMELLDKYSELQVRLYNLTMMYEKLLGNYSLLLGNFSTLSERYEELNNVYQELTSSYSSILEDYSVLQESYAKLNYTYQKLLEDYNLLLENYNALQKSYTVLNETYYEHLSDYSKNEQNLQNLIYIFAAATASFIMATVYLSKHAHAKVKQR